MKRKGDVFEGMKDRTERTGKEDQNVGHPPKANGFENLFKTETHHA
jgi:hypothetical protein